MSGFRIKGGLMLGGEGFYEIAVGDWVVVD